MQDNTSRYVEKKPMIVACIPAFNEEKTIAKVIVRARKYVDRVVVVDDGSTDDTTLIAEGLGASVVRHQRNMGYGAAIRSSFNAARNMEADVAVTIDADAQHDPDQIPRLINPIREGSADIVIGSRFLDKSGDSRVPRYREAGITVLTEFAGASSRVDYTDAQSGFRAYSRKALEQIVPTEQGMGVSVEILMKAAERKLKVTEVPATIAYGKLETSTHNPLYQGLDVVASIIKFTSIRHPLLFYGGLSVVALTLSAAFGFWAIELYSKTRVLVTNLTLLAVAFGLLGILSLFVAVILFTLISVMRERS